MEESGNLGNREVMDEKLRAAAIDGDLVSFVKEARKNEIESGCSEEYFLRQTSPIKLNILQLAIINHKNEFIEKVFKEGELLPRAVTDQLINQQDDFGDTPLHDAATVGNIDFFKFLFEYEEGQQEEVLSSLRLQNKDGNTPLHLALIESKVEVATFLVKRYPDLARCCQNNDGNTLLHVAAEEGNFDDIFKLVLEYDDKQAEVKNKDGNTPLHVAFLNGRVEIARLLVQRLEQHPELARATNNKKETPLHLAIEQYRHIINLPIEEREVVGSAYLEMTELMIEKESCVASLQDVTGATPLHRAASITSTYTLQIIGFILKNCPQSVEVRDNSSKTILHLLKAVPSYKEGKDLLDSPKLSGLIDHQDKDGNTPLHLAAINLNHSMVQVLLNSSAKRNIINNVGITVEDLIKEQSEVMGEKKQMSMEVSEAIERADVTFLRERLHNFGKLFLFPRDSERKNIIHKLLQINSGMTILLTDDFVDFIKQVVESFPELICQVDHKGNTPLHILMQNSPDTMIPFAANPYNYEVSSLSNSPLVLDLLELLCWYYNRAQEEASVKGGRYVPPWLVQNEEGNTPLHEALRLNQKADVVRKLLELDIENTAKLTNKLNETPLHLLAARPESADKIDKDEFKTLKEANTEASCTFDKNGLTPLLRAAQIYSLNTISVLLEISSEATYMADEKYGKTLWHLLISRPSYSTQTLLKTVPDLTRLLKYKDYEGNTPLHLAVQSGRFDHAINILAHLEENKNETPRDLTSSGPEIPIEIKDLLEIKNDAGISPGELISSAQDIPIALDEILNKHDELIGYRSMYGIVASDMDEYVNTIGVIAALLMTITFTAAFTVPGGAVQEITNEKSKGTPILVNDIAFQAFMFFDILTMCLSTMVLFCLLWILAAGNKRNSVIIMDSSILLLLISFDTTLLTFMAAVYATTINVKPWIAIYTLGKIE